MKFSARAKAVLLNSFIVFHVVSIACWAIPVDSVIRHAVRWAVRPYFELTGLYQTWNLFAPDPQRSSFWLQAEISFSDGSKTMWEPPRNESLGYFDRYCKWRYRKWGGNMQSARNFRLWPDTARYIARQYSSGPQHISEVKLVRYWTDTPPIGVKQVKPAQQSRVLFAYAVPSAGAP